MKPLIKEPWLIGFYSGTPQFSVCSVHSVLGVPGVLGFTPFLVLLGVHSIDEINNIPIHAKYCQMAF